MTEQQQFEVQQFEDAARGFDAVAADVTKPERTRGFAAHMATEARRHAAFAREFGG